MADPELMHERFVRLAAASKAKRRRDQFAMAAMGQVNVHLSTEIPHADFARQIIALADAVIEELDQKPSSLSAQQCLNAVHALIKPGGLPGDGSDQSAERNGIILAYNTLLALANRENQP